jgi:hypothetical protein
MLVNFIKNASLVFFEYQKEKEFPLISWAWLLAIYLTGLAFWGYLFDWRNTPLDYHDWIHLNLPRYQVIKESITTSTLPLHSSNWNISHGLTDRFLVSTDTVTSPQTILLSIVRVNRFALLDIMFNYSLAAIGLFIFKRRFKLSIFIYALIFFLFTLNGHIQSHYIVGHANWGAYFLFPFFVLLCLDFVENRINWRWVAKMALLSLYTILAGGQHHFTWMMLFLSVLGIVKIRQLGWVLAAIFASGFLSAIRLLPPVLIIDEVTSKNIFSFRSGYPGIKEIVDSFITIRLIDYDFGIANLTTGYWEYNYFIGLVGFALVVYGTLAWLKDQTSPFSDLIIPTLVVTLLSMGFLYEYTLYKLPIFASERVISRMISLPFSLILMISAIYWQKIYTRYANRKTYIFASIGLLFLLNDLLTHTRLWNIKRVANFFGTKPMNFSETIIQNRHDPEYAQILIIAVILSLTTALLLSILVLIEKAKNNKKKA